MTKEPVQTLTRPENKGVIDRNSGGVKPYMLDPELMQLHIADLMIAKLGTPSVLDKAFIARKALFKALNHRDPVYDKEKLKEIHLGIDASVRKMYPDEIHPYKIWKLEYPDQYAKLVEPALIDPGNPTGLDFSLWIDFYEGYERGSINENGLYFHNFWAWLNKPKYIIQGNAATMGMPQEEEKQSVIGRVIGWFRGGKKNDNPQQ